MTTLETQKGQNKYDDETSTLAKTNQRRSTATKRTQDDITPENVPLLDAHKKIDHHQGNNNKIDDNTKQSIDDKDDENNGILPNSYQPIQSDNNPEDKILAEQLDVGAKNQSIFQDLRGDYLNLLVLLLLYILQGFPIGLAITMPVVMRERGVGYAAQAVFSLVTLPFSLKLLWSPLVDTFFFKKFGKRKSWIVPTQILCGISLIWYAPTINHWITGGATGEVNVSALSAFFIFLYFLMSTQDIAVDSLALTLLRQRNVIWAGTINNIGQVWGMYATNVSYLLLSSPTFCSSWLWFLLPTEIDPNTQEVIIKQQGLLDITTLMYICGVLFIVTTIVVTFLKQETPIHEYDLLHDNIWKIYELKRLSGTLNTKLSYDSLFSENNSNVILTKKKNEQIDKNDNDNDNNTDNDNDKQKNNFYPFDKALYPYIITTAVPAGDFYAIDDKITNKTKDNTLNEIITNHDKDEDCTKNPLNTIQILIQQTQAILQYIAPNDIQQHRDIIDNVILKERRYIANLEDSMASGDNDSLTLTMTRIWSILQLSNIRLVVFWLLTHRIGVAAADSLTELKLYERGLQKEQIAYITSITAPITFIIPVYLTSIIASSKRSFLISISALPPRIILAFTYVLFVAIFPTLYFYEFKKTIFLCLFGLTVAQQFIALVQMVSGMSFFAIISDPKVAGTFITMLHTAANIGGMSMRLVSMYLVELISVPLCIDKKLNSFEFLKITDNTTGYSFNQDYVTTVNKINGTNINDLYTKQFITNIEYLEEINKSFIQSSNNNNNDSDNKEQKQQHQQQQQELDFSDPLIQSILNTKSNVNNIIDAAPTPFQTQLYSISYFFMTHARSIMNALGFTSNANQSLLFNPLYMLRNDIAPQLPQTPLYTCQPQLISTASSSDTIIKTPSLNNNNNNDDKTTFTPQVRNVFEQALSIATTNKALEHFSNHNNNTNTDKTTFEYKNMCQAIGGDCTQVVDGYFVQVLTCGVLGLIYFILMWPKLNRLDTLPLSSWRSTH